MNDNDNDGFGYIAFSEAPDGKIYGFHAEKECWELVIDPDNPDFINPDPSLIALANWASSQTEEAQTHD